MAPISEKVATIKEKVNAKANLVKGLYAKLIRLIHGRDFLAECLATFILVVRDLYLNRICHFNL